MNHRAEKTGGAEGGSLGLKSAELYQQTPAFCRLRSG